MVFRVTGDSMGIIREAVRLEECIYKYEDSFVFYTMESSGIYSWDSVNERCRELGFIDENENSWLYVTCMEINNILYFIPYKAKHMLGYHLDTNEFEKIFIWDRETTPMYHKAAYCHDKIYLFPEIGNEIFIYNIKTGQREFCKVQVAVEGSERTFFREIFRENNWIWSVTGQDTNVYGYNIEENRYQKFTLKNSDKIINLTGAGKELFLLTRYGKVIVWNMESGEEKVLFDSASQLEEPYFAIRYSFNKLWMIPRYDDFIRVIDLSGTEKGKWDLSHLPEKQSGMFESVVQQDEFLFMNAYCNGILVVADTKKCQIEIKDIRMDVIQLLKAASYNSDFEKQKFHQNIGTDIWKTIKDN